MYFKRKVRLVKKTTEQDKQLIKKRFQWAVRKYREDYEEKNN